MGVLSMKIYEERTGKKFTGVKWTREQGRTWWGRLMRRPDIIFWRIRRLPLWLAIPVFLGFALFLSVLMSATANGIALLILSVPASVLLAFKRYLFPEFTQILVVGGIVGVGTALYMFRCRMPQFYGLSEIAVGFFFAVFVVNQISGKPMPNDGAYFAAFGALYIIVRGYDNVYRSLTAGTVRTRRWNKRFFGQDTDAKL